MTLTNDLLKKKEQSHPHEQEPLPISQNCCNRRNYYYSSRPESKNYGEKRNAKDREVSRTKISILMLPPTTAIDTHVMTEKRDSIHRFPQNIEFNRR